MPQIRDHGEVTVDPDGTVPRRADSGGARGGDPGGGSGTGWAAPTATGPVRATVAVPGSKSLTNRALILAAQATGPSVLSGALRSRDTDLMAAGLRALGVP